MTDILAVESKVLEGDRKGTGMSTVEAPAGSDVPGPDSLNQPASQDPVSDSNPESGEWPYPEIPKTVSKNWQQIVDLMAELINIPSGMIVRALPRQTEVFVTSNTVGNPYQQGAITDMGSGLYCEAVISKGETVHIPNALKDPEWSDTPGVGMGMISYYGCPLTWPDGNVFGTLCVLDQKERTFSKVEQDLINQFSESINAYLKIVADSSVREAVLKDLTNPDQTPYNKLKHCCMSALGGAALLCSFSTVQKLFIGAPLAMKGYLVPVVFGAITGMLLCLFMGRARGRLVTLKQSLNKLTQMQAVIMQRENSLSQAFKDLSRKNEEIESFNRTMIGREDRMLELKAEVNKLSSELDVPPPYKAAEETVGESAEQDLHDGATLDLACMFKKTSLLSVLESFTKATGVAAAVIDMKGDIIVASNWLRVCTDFHRKNKESCIRCIESDTYLANLPGKDQEYSIYKCRNGMTDASSPIVINGDHVANAFIGQFLQEEPDPEEFRARAREFGFDEEDYLQAINEAAVIPEQQLQVILGFITGFAKLSAEMGIDNIRYTQNVKRLKFEQQKLDTHRRSTLNLLEDMRTAQNAIRESEAKFKALAENSTDVIMRFDREHRHLYVNPVIEKQEGIKAEEFIGKTHKEMNFPPDLVELWDEALEKVFLTGKQNRIECLLPSGTWIDWLLSPEFSDDGDVVAVITASRDITERKLMEQELRESSMKLQESVRAANIGLWDWNVHTNEVHFSREWKQQIGYEEHEISNDFGEWESRVHPDDLTSIKKEIESAFMGQTPVFEGEFRFRHKDGSYRWIHAKATKVMKADGQLERWIGSHTDITRHKEAEELLKSQVDELQRWHSVTLDREDRIHQLKLEVNDLAEKLGEANRYVT